MDGVLNFRDVGSSVHNFSTTPKLNEGVLYRSAHLDGASQADHVHLQRTLAIRTIIDLRSKTEHIAAARRHAPPASTSSDNPQLNSRMNEAPRPFLQIPGITYAEINLNGGAFERALLWRLRYTSLARLLWLMALGHREEAISILGREVMKPRGLIGLSKDTLDYSTAEIRQVFMVLADEQSYPVLVHCTHGKDRTGIIIILILMLCDIDLSAISEDYMRSGSELEVQKKERVEEFLKIGLSEEFAGCPSGFVKEMARHIQDRYGNVSKYLCGIDVDAHSQQSIRRIMLGKMP